MMRVSDRMSFAWSTVKHHRLRSFLTVLGIIVGIASVIVLTALGDGVKGYISRQFTQFGTGLVIMTPGKTEVFGMPGNLGGTYRDITFADCQQVAKIRGVRAVVPVVAGSSRIEFHAKSRDVQVYGTTTAGLEVWDMDVRQGRYVQADNSGEGPAEVVLGSTVADELFSGVNPLGKKLRVGETGYRVVGVLEPKGSVMGIDVNDSVTIPAARALRLFNTRAIQEVDIKLVDPDAADVVMDRIRDLMTDRHDEEDVTLVSQNDLLESLGSIMDVMKFAVTAIAAVSLFVGAVGILTIMWIGVHERRQEIGLLKSIGATPADIRAQFLIESGCLSFVGGLVGLCAGHGLLAVVSAVAEGFPVQIDLAMTFLALGVSVVVGVLAGLVPAERAAEMEAADALRAL